MPYNSCASPPPFPFLFRDISHEMLLLQQFQTLLALGPIRKAPLQPQVRSSVPSISWSPNPKERGDLSSVCDLIRYVRFHMVILATILPTLNQNDWFSAESSGCLFPCGNPPKPQKVHKICHGGSTRSVHYSSLWPDLSTS